MIAATLKLCVERYDYAQAEAYFVMLVCQQRLCLLEPTPVRDLVQTWWDKLPEKFPIVETDEFVVMSNHIYGIIVIVDPDTNVGTRPHVGTDPRVGADTWVCPYEDSL